ncbi:hypothetical protein BKE30_12985 [Alkanindiges hydrocarboniclasticus]|jgi:pimeloyl-ACP methyl ester carboxylesterase|uniref:GPI inositol-deacylase PGAP1-like alpha/beta domain-containing protein n=1 Tax=Alkanindiges hydrocarboniclasticus TaxID=1907941 RepID=A0A1S8CSZ7_9GAMM|nr:hypothetical protein BKE30_12985 [Alkanindiges hydrocarboniclasticus]
MPSLTPLHENYCKFDRSPPSQADFLEGLSQLATSSVSGVAELVQEIHREIFLQYFSLTTRQANFIWDNGITKRVYGLSQRIMQQYGKGLAISLRGLNRHFPVLHEKPLTPLMHFIANALNGVLGDYMFQSHNPLALPMVLYDRYGQLQRGELSGRVVILVHGLCMNHLSWAPGESSGLGEHILYHQQQANVLYLNYNTGRRISSNGRSFSNVLEDLIRRNPRITTIDLIGHSMGGLVSRSALFYGKQSTCNWINYVENLVCIGSPHQGAVLERLGFMFQEKIGKVPFASVLAQLANMRSAGIIDLRHGSVRDDDWEHLDAKIGQMDDCRKPAPLPSRVNTYLIAGTLERESSSSKTLEAIGDYLVSVKSGLGDHPHPQFRLKVPEDHKAVFYGLNHFEIQHHPRVREQIIAWLYPNANQVRDPSQRIETIVD